MTSCGNVERSDRVQRRGLSKLSLIISEGGRTFGDFPQTDITLATTNFANRLKALEGLRYGEGVSQNIRSTEELQRVVDHVVSSFCCNVARRCTNFDPATGRKQYLLQTPGVRAVMT